MESQKLQTLKYHPNWFMISVTPQCHSDCVMYRGCPTDFIILPFLIFIIYLLCQDCVLPSERTILHWQGMYIYSREKRKYCTTNPAFIGLMGGRGVYEG